MNRIYLSLCTGLWGATTMMAITNARPNEPSLVLEAFIGACAAGAATAPLFRRSHPLWTLLTAVLATSLGAAITAAVVLGSSDFPYTLAIGPVLVWAAILQSPQVVLVWATGLLVTAMTTYSLK